MPDLAYGTHARRPLFWVGSAKSDLRAFPGPVRHVAGFGLYLAQRGGRHPDAKPLRGFGGAAVLEIVIDHDRATFRAVYAVAFAHAIYVLHAFQKKSRRGVATPPGELELIRQRLRRAEEHYATWRQHRNDDA